MGVENSFYQKTTKSYSVWIGLKDLSDRRHENIYFILLEYQ